MVLTLLFYKTHNLFQFVRIPAVPHVEGVLTVDKKMARSPQQLS
nr:hypothetical protein [Nostoc sp. CmiVER01]MDZ8124845.1 hypothetical protein [Nostoc sp. CmiVER01]